MFLSWISMLWDFQNLRWSSMKMLLNNETNLISRMSVSRATSPINTISPNNLQQTSVAVVRNCYTRRPVSGSGFSNLPQSLPAPLPTPYYQTRARVGNDLFWGRGWFSGFFWGAQHQYFFNKGDGLTLRIFQRYKWLPDLTVLEFF